MVKIRSRSVRVIAAVASLALLAPACGGDDEVAEESTKETAAEPAAEPAEEAADEPAEEPAEEPADEPAAEPAEEAADEAADEPADVTPEVTSIATTCAPSFTYLGLQAAIAEDFFGDRGISVECVQIGNGPELAAALIAGEAQFAGNIAFNIVPLVLQGFDLVAVHQLYDAMFFDVLVRADFPLPNADGGWEAVMSDLVGSNVGVVARGVSAEDIARALFTGAGLDPDAQTYIATGLAGPTVAALAAGEIDMAITFEPGLTSAVEDGIAVRPFSIAAGDGPSSVAFPSIHETASREFVEANPNTVCAFVRGLQDGAEFVKDPANRDAVIELMQDKFSIATPELAGAIYDANIEYVAYQTPIDSAALDRVGQFLFDIGKVDRVVPAADYVVEPGC